MVAPMQARDLRAAGEGHSAFMLILRVSLYMRLTQIECMSFDIMLHDVKINQPI
jgi:hypothetical protein